MKPTHLRRICFACLVFAACATAWLAWRNYENRKLREEIAAVRKNAGQPDVSINEMDPVEMIPDLIVAGFAPSDYGRSERLLRRIDDRWWLRPESRRAIPVLIGMRIGRNHSDDERIVKCLEKIDPDWRKYSEARRAIPMLLMRFD